MSMKIVSRSHAQKFAFSQWAPGHVSVPVPRLAAIGTTVSRSTSVSRLLKSITCKISTSISLQSYMYATCIYVHVVLSAAVTSVLSSGKLNIPRDTGACKSISSPSGAI